MADNELFQYSVMPALMDGVAESGLPICRLLEHGDFGLGTFHQMAGEMVVYSGRVWQMKADGTVETIRPSDAVSATPFAMVTRFRPTVQATLPATAGALQGLQTKDDLAAWLRQRLPEAHNLFAAVCLRGRFRSITVRVLPCQQHRGQTLAELSRDQTEHTIANVSGTVVGFRSPAFSVGVGVPGLHLHFVSDDGLSGGHILAWSIEETDDDDSRGCEAIEIEAAPLSRIHIQLPTHDPDFNAAPLRPDAMAIAKAEG